MKYSVSGGRLLGTNTLDKNNPVPVYSLAPTVETGEASLPNASPGSYFVDGSSISPSSFRYWKLDPAVVSNPFSVSVGTDGTPNRFSLLAIDRSRLGAFFTITDGTSPVPGASVRLFDPINTGGYDHTSTTDQFGEAYFPHDPDATLLPQGYSYAVTATGYQNKTGTITISGGLAEESVGLLSQ